MPKKRTTQYFDIPSEMKRYFRKQLFLLGINPLSVKTDIDGLGEMLKWQYRTAYGLRMDKKYPKSSQSNVSHGLICDVADESE